MATKEAQKWVGNPDEIGNAQVWTLTVEFQFLGWMAAFDKELRELALGREAYGIQWLNDRDKLTVVVAASVLDVFVRVFHLATYNTIPLTLRLERGKDYPA